MNKANRLTYIDSVRFKELGLLVRLFANEALVVRSKDLEAESATVIKTLCSDFHKYMRVGKIPFVSSSGVPSEARIVAGPESLPHMILGPKGTVDSIAYRRSEFEMAISRAAKRFEQTNR